MQKIIKDKLEKIAKESKSAVGGISRDQYFLLIDRIVGLMTASNVAKPEEIKSLQLLKPRLTGSAISTEIRYIGEFIEVFLERIEIEDVPLYTLPKPLFSTNTMKGLDGNKDIRNSKVFIVHGHNEVMKQTTARVIEKLGLEAIILHEQANGGDTIIEKFSAHGNVGFAVVLFSKDDVGRGKDESDLKPRARQNVIFELGYFVGKLGRTRVMGLLEDSPDFEVPSDIKGVAFTKYSTTNNEWKYELVKELDNAGYSVNALKL